MKQLQATAVLTSSKQPKRGRKPGAAPRFEIDSYALVDLLLKSNISFELKTPVVELKVDRLVEAASTAVEPEAPVEDGPTEAELKALEEEVEQEEEEDLPAGPPLQIRSGR